MGISKPRSKSVLTASHWGAYYAETVNGRIVGTRPFEADESPSPINDSIVDAVYSKNRIDRPYAREGFLEHGRHSDRTGRGRERFVPVDWDTALDLVASEVKRVKTTFGNASIHAGSYGWASAGGLHHAQGLLRRFMNLYGGATVHRDSYSTGAANVLLPHVLGAMDASSGPASTWDGIAGNTQLLVAFGGLALKNTQVEAGGAATHETEKWLRELRRAGVEFVYLGPNKGTDAAGFLDAQWLQPRPHTDTAVMLGIAHTLFIERLHDQAFLDKYTVGFQQFLPYLLGESAGQIKNAEWASMVSGIDADSIRDLARRIASHRTLLTMSWSLQRADHGEQPFWMLITLAAMVGQIGLPGGGFGFGYGSMHRQGNRKRLVPSPRVPQGTNPIDSFIPVARISDMLLNPGATLDYNGQTITYPDVRMLYWCGGNPFHHHQDINRLIRAWRCPEVVVTNEIWWTATARHCDIVLPATTSLERNDIASGAFDRFVMGMQKAIEPVGEARNDFDIFADLSERIGFRDAFTEGRDEMQWLRHLYGVGHQVAAQHAIDLPDFDAFWKRGYAEVAENNAPYVLYAEYRADPEIARLSTPSGKIEIFSGTIDSFDYDDCPGHAMWIEPAEWLGSEKARQFPLHLLSSQPTTRLHGQMDNEGISLASKIQGREPMWLNTGDANARTIADGDVVRVFNDRGQCLAGAVVTDDISQGVVLIQTGAWYDPLEPGEIGTLDRHGNPNVLTLDKGTSKLAQASSAQTVLVEVEKWRALVPDITVRSGPDTINREHKSNA
jgi:biotin/methionine sulfoxide reductase